MKKTVCWLGIILLFCFLSGCGKKQEAVQPEEIIAVLDLDQAVKNHPRWLEAVQLKNQLALLRSQGEGVISADTSEKKELFDQHQLLLEKQEEEWVREQEEAEAKLNSLLAGRHKELQEKITLRSQEIEKQKLKQLDEYNRKLQKEYTSKLVDLQLKLKYLNLDNEQRAERLADLENLENERKAKLEERKKELYAELQSEMKVYQNELEQEFNAYKAAEESKIKAGLEEKRKLLAENEESSLAEAKAVHQELEKDKALEFAKLKEKADAIKKKKEDVLQAIKADIKAKTEKLAVQEKISVVLIDYKNKGNAQDITAKVIELCR